MVTFYNRINEGIEEKKAFYHTLYPIHTVHYYYKTTTNKVAENYGKWIGSGISTFMIIYFSELQETYV